MELYKYLSEVVLLISVAAAGIDKLVDSVLKIKMATERKKKTASRKSRS